MKNSGCLIYLIVSRQFYSQINHDFSCPYSLSLPLLLLYWVFILFHCPLQRENRQRNHKERIDKEQRQRKQCAARVERYPNLSTISPLPRSLSLCSLYSLSIVPLYFLNVGSVYLVGLLSLLSFSTLSLLSLALTLFLLSLSILSLSLFFFFL